MKVLILSCNTGGGHNAAAQAMVLQSMPEELRRVAVEQVRILNGLTFN